MRYKLHPEHNKTDALNYLSILNDANAEVMADSFFFLFTC